MCAIKTFSLRFAVAFMFSTLVLGAANAQHGSATQPEITFVPGEAYVNRDQSDLTAMRVAVTFATRPPFVEQRDGAKDVVSRAVRTLYGSAALTVHAGQGVGREWFRDDRERICIGYAAAWEQEVDSVDRRGKPIYRSRIDRDMWTVLAPDEDAARQAIAALLAAGREVAAEHLATMRARSAAEQEELAAALNKQEELQAGLARAEGDARAAGVADMTDEAIDGALARFEQEHRLNEVEIAGLEAGLKTIRERFAGARDAAQLTGPVVETLGRLQVELEIQLAGKLGRRDASARQLEQLRAGRDARQRASETRATIEAQKSALGERRDLARSWQAGITHWEQRVNQLGLVDRTATLSPIEQPPPATTAPARRRTQEGDSRR